MRTILITNGNILSLFSLKDWIDKYGDKVTCIVITTKLPSSKSNIREVFKILKLSGFRYTFFKIFINKVLPLYYKLTGKYSCLSEYISTKYNNIEIIYADDVNNDSIIRKMKVHNPEVVLSFSATTKFRKELISLPSKACLNAHYALLPKFAGLSPYYWYLHNDEEICGCTFHVISNKLDAGNIIEYKTFQMAEIESVSDVLLRQIKLISPMLINYYDGVTSEVSTTKQDLTKRSYYRHPVRADIIKFKKDGNNFFDKSSLIKFFSGVKK